jgi:hypothetical protein
MVATKKSGKPDLVSREPQKILGAFFARQTNNSEPAGVKVRKVADSCTLSQPRSIRSLRPAPYSGARLFPDLHRGGGVFHAVRSIPAFLRVKKSRPSKGGLEV